MRLTGAVTFVLLAASVTFAEDRELAEFTHLLNSGNAEEKTKAARMLGEIGPAAADVVPALVKSLALDDPGLRHEAVVALGRINSDAKLVVPSLNQLIANDLPIIQLSVIDALRKFGADAQESIPQLSKLLDHAEPLIAVSAARAIAEIGTGKATVDARVKSVLIAGLKSERGEISAEAIQGLAMVGADAVGPIQDLLSGTSLKCRINACDALATIGPVAAPAVGPLQAAAKSPEIELRWHAMSALGDIGPSAIAAIPALISALEDPDGMTRFSADRSLHKIGKMAVPALVEALKKESLQTRIIPILEEIGPDASEASSALAKLLATSSGETRREVIMAIAGIGQAEKKTVVELMKLAGDKQFPYRPAAAYALGKLGAKEAVPVLKESSKVSDNPMLRLASIWSLLQLDPLNEEYIAMGLPQLTTALDSEKPEFRREAAKALGRMGIRAKDSVVALQKRLSDTDPSVRRESLIALAEIGPSSATAVADITRILSEGEPALRPVAAFALGRIGQASAPAVPQLNRLLHSRDPHEKTVAAWALVNIAPDPEIVKIAIPLFVSGLIRSENVEARVELVRALGKIGSDSPEANAALNAALKDPDESVRKAAEMALRLRK